MQRGEYLRAAALHRLPPTIPAANREQWAELARTAANLNQIARKINGGQWSGADRVQVVAALMAIDAGLERLRHTVRENGADDDR
ncbi:MobC family plasmid mobilization relaxosome protein [Salmonella enterica subsp. enterica serovar Typhimurium]|nr:MobC family plasmid mobilization relaxosome protein [Salmonella enterica subsp. enterica serovar Typhimurium]MBJ3717136.1 MobC family plasmid mobilization relaxosome protein [Salmonella enterica subsp. enterica serovar London]